MILSKEGIMQKKHCLFLESIPESVSRPLWSVIIPTHNCAQYLRQTLASVLIQDPGEDIMEIIVVDDYSTKDNPERVVKDLGRGRVQFVQQQENVGKVRNYETGLKLSQGEVIHLLHGDDKIRPGFYQEMGSMLRSYPLASAAFCRSIYMDSLGRWTGMTGMIQEKEGIVENMLELLYVNQQIQTPSIVVRREVYESIGTFDRRLNAMEDWEMWTRIANNYPIAMSNQVLAEYRTHSENATMQTFQDGSALKIHQAVFDIVDGYVPESIKAKLNSLRNRHQAKFLFQSLLQCKSELPSGVINKMKRRIFSLDPGFRTLIRLFLN